MTSISTLWPVRIERLDTRYTHGGGLCVITALLAFSGVEQAFRPVSEPGSPGLKAGIIAVLGAREMADQVDLGHTGQGPQSAMQLRRPGRVHTQPVHARINL